MLIILFYPLLCLPLSSPSMQQIFLYFLLYFYTHFTSVPFTTSGKDYKNDTEDLHTADIFFLFDFYRKKNWASTYCHHVIITRQNVSGLNEKLTSLLYLRRNWCPGDHLNAERGRLCCSLAVAQGGSRGRAGSHCCIPSGEQEGCSTMQLSHLSPFHRCPTSMNTNEGIRWK